MAGCGLTDSRLPSPDCVWRHHDVALTVCWFKTPGPGFLPAAGLKLMCLCVQQWPEVTADMNHVTSVLL